MMVRTYAWVGILQDGGLINSLLGLFGIGPFKMMYTTFAVVLGMVYNFIPFMILQIHTSLIQFGIIVVLNCGIGLLTPPVGAVLFIGSAVAKRPMEKVVKATLPFYLCMFVALLLLTFVPDISLAIPKLLGGGQYVLIGNVIETQFLTSGDWNFGSAISLIMAVIIMISMYITRKVDTDPAAHGKED